MSRTVASYALTAGLFLALGGCLNVDTRIPDVQINTPSGYSGGSSNERRTPYGKELEKVLGQEKDVAKELKKRNWDDLADELNDWVNYTRKLMGKADTSRNPARMKDYCKQLLAEMETMQRAGRAHDAKAVQAGLDRVNPWLNRLSAEFPLAEPIPDAQQTEKPKPSAAP